jgi:hypothetical protein
MSGPGAVPPRTRHEPLGVVAEGARRAVVRGVLDPATAAVSEAAEEQ